MITLYHYYLCSSSRYIRLILEEHKITYHTQLENYWKPQKDFLQLNLAGHLPVLVNEENFSVDDFLERIDRYLGFFFTIIYLGSVTILYILV